MKKLKQNQLGPWCSYCEAKTTRAVWRTGGMTFIEHACDAHVKELKAYEVKNADDGHMTEADYQTWGRL